jgi:hypothetical protein
MFSEDIELALLSGDKVENGGRSRSSSELSYSYQYETNAVEPQHPVTDAEAQATHKPACIEVLQESESHPQPTPEGPQVRCFMY